MAFPTLAPVLVDVVVAAHVAETGIPPTGRVRPKRLDDESATLVWDAVAFPVELPGVAIDDRPDLRCLVHALRAAAPSNAQEARAHLALHWHVIADEVREAAAARYVAEMHLPLAPPPSGSSPLREERLYRFLNHPLQQRNHP